MSAAARIKDFENRAQFAPDAVYTNEEGDWRYIPIHPFADEEQLLQNLDLKREDCILVDAYWEVGGDVIFLTVTLDRNEHRSSGLYCRAGREGRREGMATIEGDYVTRSLFEEAMSVFYKNGEIMRTNSTRLTRIDP